MPYMPIFATVRFIKVESDRIPGVFLKDAIFYAIVDCIMTRKRELKAYFRAGILKTINVTYQCHQFVYITK
jgi:hypothetical protein